MNISQNLRTPKWDFLKGLCLLMVLFGHFIQPAIRESNALKTMFFLLYTFHMPIFCGISGYLFTKSKTPLIKKMKQYGFYLFMGQLGYSLICLAFGADIIYYSLLWYLIALSLWVSITPPLMKVLSHFKGNLSIFLAVSLILGLLVGVLPTEGMNILSPRLITYYPYFVLGMVLSQPGRIDQLKNLSPLAKGTAFALLLLALTILSINLELINYRSVFLNQDYQDMGLSTALGALIRFLLYGIGFIFMAFTFAFSDAQRGVLTYLGQQSVVIYLAHGLFIKFMMLTLTDWMTSPFANLGISLLMLVILLFFGFWRASREKILD